MVKTESKTVSYLALITWQTVIMCLTGTPYLIIVGMVETESKTVSYLALITWQTVTVCCAGLSGVLSGALIHMTVVRCLLFQDTQTVNSSCHENNKVYSSNHSVAGVGT